MTWLLEHLARHARQTPQAVALENAEQTLTYRDLQQRVKSLAAVLRTAGVKRLALCGGNSPAWVIADLAAHGLGLPVVPVPPFFSDQQKRHLIQEAGLDASYNSDTQRLTLTGIQPTRREPGLAKVTFTSGSTGTPKGVRLGDEVLERTVTSLATALSPHAGRRHLALLPLATLLENIAGVYVPLCLGARVLLPDLPSLGFTGSSGLDPKALIGGLHRWQPHSLILVPELLRALVMMADAGAPMPDSLQFIAVGGGKVDAGLLQRVRAHGLPVYEGYGLSECGSVVALNLPGADRPGSVGRVLPHAQARIDAHNEIHVSGSVMRGYLSQHAGDEWPTGDLGRLDENSFLYVDGRRKNLLITAFGRNVNPEWVESAFQDCAAIQTIVVQGDGEPRLSAVVVAAGNAELHQVEEQIESVNAGLPDYARVTAIVLTRQRFSVENGLATANGRPRRDAIADRYPVKSATPLFTQTT